MMNYTIKTNGFFARFFFVFIVYLSTNALGQEYLTFFRSEAFQIFFRLIKTENCTSRDEFVYRRRLRMNRKESQK